MPYTNPAPETVETFWSDGFDARCAAPVVQEFTPPHDALTALQWLDRARTRCNLRRCEVSDEIFLLLRRHEDFYLRLEKCLCELDGLGDANLIFTQMAKLICAEAFEEVVR